MSRVAALLLVAALGLGVAPAARGQDEAPAPPRPRAPSGPVDPDAPGGPDAAAGAVGPETPPSGDPDGAGPVDPEAPAPRSADPEASEPQPDPTPVKAARPSDTTSSPGKSSDASITVQLPGSGGDLSTTIKVALAMTALALLPALLVTATSFGRILIVLGFVRVGLGTPSAPPNQVLIGLALALTLLAMGPTLDQVQAEAVEPYVDGRLEAKAAAAKGLAPVRAFLLRHCRQRHVETFVALARGTSPATPDDIPLRVLLPAFITSELTTAFEMGVVILVPFLVIDLVVASVLLAMNMMMLPPATVATPMKLLLFVLVDGWTLLSKALVTSAA